MSKKIIQSLYEQYKNTPKKLKIICDWDEVIQPCEPYASWQEMFGGRKMDETDRKDFAKYFKKFWENDMISYSPYGSSLKGNFYFRDLNEHEEYYGREITLDEKIKEQQKYKNSPNFYHQAPFLTIAEDLLKLIKEDKVEKLIFLSAYDKRVFPKRDDRKIEIFAKTFFKLNEPWNSSQIDFKSIGFINETYGKSKADWIKENAPDFDIVIDDNPNICESLAGFWPCNECIKSWNDLLEHCKTKRCKEFAVLAPYYPAIENQHHKEVLLIKNEVSNLNKEDFSKHEWHEKRSKKHE